MTSSKSMSSEFWWFFWYVPFLTLCVLDVAGRIALIVGLLSFLSSSSIVTWAITGCEGPFPLYGFDATTAKFHFGFDRRLSRSNVRLVHIWPVASSKLNGNESSGWAWLIEYLKRTSYKHIQVKSGKSTPRSILIFHAHPNLKSIMYRNANSKEHLLYSFIFTISVIVDRSDLSNQNLTFDLCYSLI